MERGRVAGAELSKVLSALRALGLGLSLAPLPEPAGDNGLDEFLATFSDSGGLSDDGDWGDQRDRGGR